MDTIANMLTIIKNGYMAKKSEVVAPFSKHKLAIAKIMANKKFIQSAEIDGGKLKIKLAYENKRPKITEIQRVSKPGLKIYIKSKNIKKVKGGRGFIIISTPDGVTDGEDAKAKNLGGEVICKVW